MKPKTTLVCLTGGLGNQLFQLAAALALNPNETLLDNSLGKPRGKKDIPDLSGFRLPDGVELNQKGEASWFYRKVAGFLLRTGIQRRGLENIPGANSALRMIGTLVLSYYFKSLFAVRACKGVGFSSIKPASKTLLIGYFQSYKYVSDKDVFTKMMSLNPVNESEKLRKLIERAQCENPIFVHYRLGDYLKESHFGMPSEDFYEKSIQALDGNSRNIWVFSDDPVLAESKFPDEFRLNAYFVDDRELTPAQVLHLFRFGNDYVLANSSFSWWGAMLRMKQDCKVIAPKPWFAGMPEPHLLIPDEWCRLNAREM